MATNGNGTHTEAEIGVIVSRTEEFIEKNTKKIIYGVVAIAVVVGAFVGFNYAYLVPQEKKANAAMFKG
ncbi:MAG: hypothetical protein AB7V54_11060, partial [Parabacteroides sp.]